MGLWNSIKETFKNIMGPKDIQDVIHMTPTVSSEMANAINLWKDMYEDHAPWLHEPDKANPVRVTSLGLPALIAREKAMMATLEMETEISAPTEEVEEDNPNYVKPSIDETTGDISMGRGTPTIKKDVPKGNTDRADFLNDQYKNLQKQIRRQLEYGIAKGGLVIKPYPVLKDGFTPNSQYSEKLDKTVNTKDTSVKSEETNPGESGNGNIDNNAEVKEKKKFNASIEFDFIQADGFYPLSFDATGKITEAAFIQRKIDKDNVYSRLEWHKLEKNTVTVCNYAFRSPKNQMVAMTNITSLVDLGQQIPLTAVPEWASLEQKIVIQNVDRLLFAYFRMPEANTIDSYSPLGVSGYSRVVKLIRDADMQYSRLLWEYEGGELAIDVDRDALKLVQDSQGRDVTVRPVMQERLFRKVDLNSEETYEVFAPNLRDANYNSGLNSILTRIEDAVGLSRGTISNQNLAEAKTATELKILKQRSYCTNADIQAALEDALRDTIYIMDVYCSLYKITAEGEYEVSFEWDDSILVDAEAELSKRLTLMNNQLTSRLETRMWYFNETENQAKAALQKIDDEAKSNMETNMMAQQQLGEVAQKQSNDDLQKTPGQQKQAAGANNAYNNTAKKAGEVIGNKNKSDNSSKNQ